MRKARRVLMCMWALWLTSALIVTLQPQSWSWAVALLAAALAASCAMWEENKP
jgi:hypothetical protein